MVISSKISRAFAFLRSLAGGEEAIAEGPSKPGKIKYSVQFKFVITFFAVIAVLIALMNTYPLIASRDLVFASKQSSLQSQTSVMSSALSSLDTLTVEGVSQVMELLDVIPLDRIIITDDAGKILYDTSSVDSGIGRYALFSEISRSLSGNAVFYSQFKSDAFMSRSAMPVIAGGVVIGAVYLYEYDSKNADLITGIQSNIRNISFAIAALSLAMIFLFTKALTRRITELVRAIRIVRDGNYDHLIITKGSDEITELGDEFNNMTKQLKDTEELRRRFVSDASHELRTPLASIRLLTDSIVQSDDMDIRTMREFVLDIGSEAERLQRTTAKLLSLTRLDSDVNFPKTEVDIKRVINRALHMLTPLAQKRDVELSLNLRDGCRIFAYEDDIYQIVFNLVENGIKYNKAGGRVSVGLRRDKAFTLLTVEDTGIGIPAEDVPHIFSRFYRVDKARSHEAGGSGLGLSIVRDAAKLYGGTVEVAPGDGQGTVFKVTFPLYIAEKGEAQ